jgi:hypothetical protein
LRSSLLASGASKNEHVEASIFFGLRAPDRIKHGNLEAKGNRR